MGKKDMAKKDIAKEKRCTLCGGTGHTVADCPWLKKLLLSKEKKPDKSNS